MGLNITPDDSRRDIVAEGFDAGIHFGEYIQKDMITVRVSPDHRPAIVACSRVPGDHAKPKVPRDLRPASLHQLPTRGGGTVRGSSRKGEKSVSVAVTGPLSWKIPIGPEGCIGWRRLRVCI